MTTDTEPAETAMPKRMSDKRLDEIRAEYEAFGGSAEIAELLAEVDRMRAAEALVQEQVGIVRRIGEAEADRAAYEAMDRERRGWESRRANDNVKFAELRREVEKLRADLAEEQRLADDRRTELLEERDSALHNLQEAETDRDRRVEQVNRVRELHKATPDSDTCPVCGDDEWLDGECPTIRALDRTEASS